MATIKSLQTINTGESVEKREHSYILGGNANWYSHYGEHCGDSSHRFLTKNLYSNNCRFPKIVNSTEGLCAPFIQFLPMKSIFQNYNTVSARILNLLRFLREFLKCALRKVRGTRCMLPTLGICWHCSYGVKRWCKVTQLCCRVLSGLPGTQFPHVKWWDEKLSRVSSISTTVWFYTWLGTVLGPHWISSMDSSPSPRALWLGVTDTCSWDLGLCVWLAFQV